MPDLSDLRRVHVVVIQPAGYVHSLGLLDPALYLRHQLGRLGIEVSLGKNRLREDAVNVVLGAHLGFAPRLRERHACVFLNLEQIGSGGAALPPGYVELLKTSPTADCDPENVSGYASDPGLVPVLPFLHAPYLCAQEPAPLWDRPIDLLFFGSLNERRARLIERVRACGRNVHVLAAPLYGPERDHLVRQARAVLNCHFYEAARFESIRAHVCLSLGTPLVSEPAGSGGVLPPFQEAVEWFDDSNLEAFFTARFGTEAFFADAQRRLAGWRKTDAGSGVRGSGCPRRPDWSRRGWAGSPISCRRRRRPCPSSSPSTTRRRSSRGPCSATCRGSTSSSVTSRSSSPPTAAATRPSPSCVSSWRSGRRCACWRARPRTMGVPCVPGCSPLEATSSSATRSTSAIWVS
jgi:hypothetical protein